MNLFSLLGDSFGFFVSGKGVCKTEKRISGSGRLSGLELWDMPGYESGRISTNVRLDGYPVRYSK